MRRGRAFGSGSVNSVITSVCGSARPILLLLNSSKYGMPFESRRTPYGREFAVGDSTSLMLPFGALGSSVPRKLPACTVKNSRPSDRNAIVCGSAAFGFGILYSVILPVFGSILPIRPAAFPVYQMLPSLSACSPCGPELAVGSVYSLNCCVAGSKRPTTLARWPVYQIEPSGATAGSCGYGGLLGVIHWSNFTSTESLIAACATATAATTLSSSMAGHREMRIGILPSCGL